MKHALAFVALLSVATTHALAQEATPTPEPDPRSYVDAGMTYTAPVGAILLNRITVTPEQLGTDLQPVAAWVLHAGQEDARVVQLSMEAYDGSPDQWEAQFESQTHSSQDGTLIRNKTPMTLLNGMPAYFLEVAYGSGFDSRKEYAIVWADGMRGVVLALTTRLGDVTSEEARKVLGQATAVRYPEDQP